MRVLFDHNVPVTLRHHLSGHEVNTAAEFGWSELSNGRLLDAAKRAGIDFMVTGDQRIVYQQNLVGRQLALVVLSNPAWPVVRENVAAVAAAVNRAAPGGYEEVVFARRPLLRRPWRPSAS